MTPAQPSPDHDTHHETDGAVARDRDPGRHGPWAAPLPDKDEPARPPTRHWFGEIAQAVLVALPVLVLTGTALGLLWLWRAPRLPLVSDGEQVLLVSSEGEQVVGADGTFLLYGLAVGAVAGLVVFLLRRTGGVAVVVGLAAGSLLGSLLAWGIGTWFGPTDDIRAHARAVGPDVVFDGPLELTARGVLMGLPLAALGVHLACMALWGPRDPAPQPPVPVPSWGVPDRQPGAPAGDAAPGHDIPGRNGDPPRG
ncbi:ABC transporter permease [Streptomyces sp. B6B3]|uniref:ABC transporter permease n=1 Tax=Streptomyces sp. B6B3 TaxID=3153570 RepID=UPI00325E366E